MATALSAHMLRVAKSKLTSSSASRGRGSDGASVDSGAVSNPSNDLMTVASNMSKYRFLEGVHVYRAHDQVELLAILDQLPAFLKVHTRIRLIVVDSIAFHFRQQIQDSAKRARMLSAIAQNLNQVAYNHNVAVLLTNHVTTRVHGGDSGRGPRREARELWRPGV